MFAEKASPQTFNAKPSDASRNQGVNCRPGLSDRGLSAALHSESSEPDAHDFEIVVVDDHSPGDVPAILHGLPSDGPVINYIRHDRNRGALCARLTGIDHSNGDYVGFIDCDDCAHTAYVQRLLAAARETDAGIIGSAKNAANLRPPFQLEGAEALLDGYATGKIANWSVWTKLYARPLLEGLAELRAIGTETNFIKANDLIFNVFCALQGPRYVNIEETLIAHNRERPGSATHASSRMLRTGELSVYHCRL